MSLPNPFDSSSGLSLLGNELVVDLARSLSGRTRAQKIPIALERGPLVDRAEHHAPADMRSDINVRGGEAVARDILAAVELILERGERLLAGAIADHPRLLRTNSKADGLIGV